MDSFLEREGNTLDEEHPGVGERMILSLLGWICLLDHWVWHPGQKAGGQFKGLCGHLWFISVWLPYATIDMDQVVPGEQQREKRLRMDSTGPCIKHVQKTWATQRGG